MTTRRQFISAAGAAAAGSLLAPLYTTANSFAAQRERVAIIGAGIAGLTCATILRDGGIDATIYESSNRLGGRMHSLWNYWNEGQHTEFCGSMIDSKHLTLHALAHRFKQPLVDTWATLQPHARDTSYFGGRYYSMIVADRDFRPVYATLRRQLAQMGAQTTWDSATPMARELDAMSMSAWIDRYIPGGHGSQLGKLVDDALSNEYGVASSQQSSLNLVYMLGEQIAYDMHGGEMNVLGYSDQRYTTRYGNQRLAMTVAQALPNGSVLLEHRMTAIKRLPGGKFQLSIDTPHGKIAPVYDRVVLALPFVVLRNLDYSGAGFDARKRKAIEELGYGTHTKLQVQFDSRPWMQPGPWEHPSDGQIWTDTGFQNSVDFSLGQPGRSGIIERFTYGTAGLIDTPPVPYATADQSPVVHQNAQLFFEQLDKMWPGVSRHWNGKAAVGNAQADPNLLASYSTWLVGQCTSIAGYEKERQGRIHFCGEHTSVEYQGFMEGGAASGVRAANEVLGDYGIRPKTVASASNPSSSSLFSMVSGGVTKTTL